MIQDLYKQKRSLELRWQLEYEQSGKYTLNMVEIDEKIKSIITQIKAEEFKIADRENKISNSAAQVSVATWINATSLKSYISVRISCTLLKFHIYFIHYTNFNKT